MLEAGYSAVKGLFYGADISELQRTPAKKPTDIAADESSSKMKKIAIGVFCGLLAAGATYVILQNLKVDHSLPLPKSQPQEPELHPNELAAKVLFGQEVLQLDADDARPKALFFAPITDENNAFAMQNNISNYGPISRIFKFMGYSVFEPGLFKQLQSINAKHDLQFKVAHSVQDICTNIKAAVEIGDLKTIIISGHGNESSITLNNDLTWDGEIAVLPNGTINGIGEDCFADLPEDAQISIVSCFAGSSDNGIASAIARLAKRVVWAPRDKVSSVTTSFEGDRVPAVPNFWDIVNWGFRDITCKFQPDGSRSCNSKANYIMPAIYSLFILKKLYNFYNSPP